MSKYSKLLEFKSVRKYLRKSIGSKKSSKAASQSLEQKIEEVSLTNYLRGVYLFFYKYENSLNLDNPADLVDYYHKHRDNIDKLDDLESEIDQKFIKWLYDKYSGKTAESYQSHLRGFCSRNRMNFDFKNYDSPTQKKRSENLLNITHEDKLKFSKKIFEFINDLELNFFLKLVAHTGLSWNTISNLTFEMLRNRLEEFNDVDLVEFRGVRQKTSAFYSSFFHPRIHEIIKAYLRKHEDKPDDAKIFAHTDYNNLYRQYKTAYEKCIEAYFPKWKKNKTATGNLKTIFSFHSFRDLFVMTAKNLAIPEFYINLFIAHKQKKINDTNYSSMSSAAKDYFEEIIAELWGEEKKSEDEIKKELIGDLLDLIKNTGKRKALFKKYNEDQSVDVDYQLQIALFLENYKQDIIDEMEDKIANRVMEKIGDKISEKIKISF